MMAHAMNVIKRECEAVTAAASSSEFLMSHHHQQQQHHHIMSAPTQVHHQHSHQSNTTKMGSRRIFTAHFKLQVLDSYRTDTDCKGNQRATARKYGIHRRQIQKWLQCESNLRTSVMNGTATSSSSHNNNNNHKLSAINEIKSEINGNASAALLNGVELSLGVSSSSSPPSLGAATNKFSFSHRSTTNNNNLHHHLTSPPTMSAAVAASITGCRFSPAHTHTIDYTPVAAEPTTSTSLPVSATSSGSGNNNTPHMHHHREEAKCCSPFYAVSAEVAAATASASVGRSNAITSSSDRLPQQQQALHEHLHLQSKQPQHHHHQHQIQAPFHYLVKPAAFDAYWSHQQTHRRDGASSSRDDYDDGDNETVRPTTQTEIPTTPIDLSVHTRAITVAAADHSAAHPKRFWEQSSSADKQSTNVPRPQTEESGAWDLSAGERKRKSIEAVHELPSPPKAVKLFKPYLNNDDEASDSEASAPPTEDCPTAFKPIARRQHDPIIWSNYGGQLLASLHDQTATANNRTSSLFFPCSSVSPALSAVSATSGSSSAYRPTSADYNPATADYNAATADYNPVYSPSLAFTAGVHEHFNHGSPVSGYDTASSSYSTTGSDCGADDRHSLSSRCSSEGTGSSAADPAEHSIGLKMQAIDSFYNDSLCRGSERAVADKFSVHRRDVQRWLMQEDDLRHLVGNQL